MSRFTYHCFTASQIFTVLFFLQRSESWFAQHVHVEGRWKDALSAYFLCLVSALSVIDPVERVAWLSLLNKARQRCCQRKVRHAWFHHIRLSEFAEFHNLLQELRQEECSFIDLCTGQWNPGSHWHPHNLPGHLLQPTQTTTFQDKNHNQLIPANERLSVCLR